MRSFDGSNFDRGFTRTDLLCFCGALLLLTLIAFPLLANNGTRADRVACVGNLRQIGRGFHQWATEHEGLTPWFVDTSSGGVKGHPLGQNLWFHYAFLGNQLGSPSILLDPADKRPFVRMARTWNYIGNGSGTPLVPGDIGFTGYQNNSVSYWLCYNAVAWQPRSVLAGDHNILTAGPSLIDYPFDRRLDSTATWTNSVHGDGNLAFMDGSVQQADNMELRRAIEWNNNWNEYFAFPQ